MNVIIIEDEKLSAEHIENLLKRIDPAMKVIAKYDSVKGAVAGIQKGEKADLLFVDIHLADGLSFEIFSKVSIDTPVIFTTAYNEYAIKAFKVNSVDYLLKPIGIEELRAAVEKFKRLNKDEYTKLVENIAASYQNITKQHKARFMVKMGDTIVSVKTDDVEHFVSEDGLVLLVSNSGKRFPVDYTLDQLEELVGTETFFRINRKVLICINAIQKVSSYFNSRLKITANLLEDEAAVVSRERVNEFKQWLDK